MSEIGESVLEHLFLLNTVVNPGEGPQGARPPLFLDQTEA